MIWVNGLLCISSYGMDSFYCMVRYAPCNFFVSKPKINRLEDDDFYFSWPSFLMFFREFFDEEGEKKTHLMC